MRSQPGWARHSRRFVLTQLLLVAPVLLLALLPGTVRLATHRLLEALPATLTRRQAARTDA